uniref:Major facilitator superfamily (MFS) profile domain-containing protein n=1 Tax=Helicotheca tamesis TaxID=374047 RepID=A0A7S2I9T4_9STRA|mmetsp:Transcript_6979/g.9436  ORF Transcript_6979/g.9436 Transcript_6979/m.9436 type:complete len:386 (+) Transcript_6979:156-1313(+)
MPGEEEEELTCRKLLSKIRQGFTSLSNSPTELYIAYLLKFLDSYSYFSFSIIFTLFLSEDFGFSDVAAGSIYGAWGALVTIYGLISGVIVDNMGVAKSLKIGFCISCASRIAIFATTSKTMLLWNVCLFLPFGNCLGIPVLTTGIRRYTTEQNRGFAFGLFYVIMNVAALLSGPVVDMCTILYKGAEDDEGENDNDVDDGNAMEDGYDENKEWSFTGYRMVILTGVVANIVACVVTLFIREIKLSGTATTNNNNNNRNNNNNTDSSETTSSSSSPSISTFQPLRGTPTQILRETLSTPSFWRFLAVCLITLNIRMIFRHLDATLPKYMVREFGPNTPKGTIYSINPALIIILVPIIQAATREVDPLVMIHYGIYISALSVFFFGA